MKKRTVAGIMIAGFIALNGKASAEQVEISTYYPSPVGNYKNLETTDNTALARTGGKVGVGMTGAAAVQKLDVAGNVRVASTVEGVGTLALSGTGGNVQINGNVGVATAPVAGTALTVNGNTVLDDVMITGGTPAVGQVLTSDGAGNATWEPPAAFYS